MVKIENSIGFCKFIGLRVQIDTECLVKDFIQQVGHEVERTSRFTASEKLVDELKIAKDPKQTSNVSSTV